MQKTNSSDKMKTYNQNFTDFLSAFADTLAVTSQEASDQWAGFTRQLSDKERCEIENGGMDAGIREGRAFNEMFVAA